MGQLNLEGICETNVFAEQSVTGRGINAPQPKLLSTEAHNKWFVLKYGQTSDGLLGRVILSKTKASQVGHCRTLSDKTR